MQGLMPAVLPMLLPPVVALVTARVALAGLCGTAARWDLLDRPTARKRHPGAVPLVGGLALLAGMATGALVSWGLGRAPWVAGQSGPVLLLLLSLFGLGLWDDARGKSLGAWVKASVSVLALAAFAAVAGGVGLPALVLAFLVVHSFNTSDNMNGLAGGVALAGMLAWWLAAAWGLVQTPFPQTSAVGAGALAAFLALNFPRGRVFLGDSGSLLLGGWFAAAFLVQPHPGLLCFAALPLADLGTVALLRLAAGRRPWVGDRRHLSHRLARRAGLGDVRAVCLLVGAQVLANGAGLWLLHAVPRPDGGTWAWVTAGFGLLCGAALLVRDPARRTEARA